MYLEVCAADYGSLLKANFNKKRSRGLGGIFWVKGAGVGKPTII